MFATHSVRDAVLTQLEAGARLRYGAARAHNRHMADFCKTDDRLMGVAAIPLDDPDLAMAELEFRCWPTG